MLDPTTLAAYRAAQTAPARAQAVRDSLGSGTLTVELREGASLVYSGTFSGPMTAGADGSLSASAQLSGLVTTAGTPNAATWTCRIANGSGRYIEGSFGPGGRFTWSQGTLRVGDVVRLDVSIAAAGGGWPAWYSAMTPDEWSALPDSTLTTSGEGWSGTHPGGTGDYTMVVKAYSGGIINTVGLHVGGAFVAGTWFVVWGGGHGDYGGNELYAYGPIESEVPLWHRLNDPTIPAPDDVARVDGYPVARHTYDTLVYLPTENKMLAFGAPGQYSTGNSAHPWCELFDFSVDPQSTNPWTALPDLGAGGGVARSGYNSVTEQAWSIGGGNGTRLHRYDVASGAFAMWPKDNPTMGIGVSPKYGNAAIIPTENVLVFVDDLGDVQVQDLANPSAVLYAPTVSGSGPSGNVSIAWDSDNDRFLVKAGAGRTLHSLTPSVNPLSGTWTWADITPLDGYTPSAITATGGYHSHFQTIKSGGIRGLLIQPGPEHPLALYRF